MNEVIRSGQDFIQWVRSEYQIFGYEQGQAIKRERIARAKNHGFEQERKVNAFDLLPDVPTESEKADYQDKLICMVVAGGKAHEFERLYERVSFGKVWEMYALQKLHAFETPRD